ncbi:hypothetical protein TWF696_008225 [Orbilia brochopaga]|uniref:Hint domain-containing protein n=1 Tax=Orbilia brochopaga TaxID=3140254 RepID=A0AAV9UF51_9PEZI
MADTASTHGPTFFQWTQSNPVALNSHYTAVRAIAKLTTSLSGHWVNGDYEPLYFPNAGIAPAIPATDTTDYHSVANAFVCQAIYNGDGDAKQNCDWNSTQTTVDAFNKKLWDGNFDRYIDWFGWDASIQTTGAHCTYQEYYDAITNGYWISIKAAQQVQGTWPNQSLEMFMHFLKLNVLGASDTQIEEIYNLLTTPSDSTRPRLAAGGFGDITPSTYKLYRSYITPGPVSYSQLSVQGLNTSATAWTSMPTEWGMSEISTTYYADLQFLHDAGYWTDPPSGCCFAAGTQVVLADGVTTKPIDQIVPGDEVLSPSRTDEKAVRKCLFLSRPARNGRSLFSYLEHDGIQFTATHPLLQGYDKSGDPILGFVDVSAAVRVNPTWAAFETVSLPREQLIQTASCGAADAEEVLYDIIFDDDETSTRALATYVVQDNNGNQHANASRFFPHGLTAGVVNYSTRLKKLRDDCVAEVVAITASNTDSESSSFRKEHLSALFSSSALSFQVILDSIEALIISTGLSIQAELDNYWIHRHSQLQQQTDDSKAEYTVISSHFIGLKHDLAELNRSEIVDGNTDIGPVFRRRVIEPAAMRDDHGDTPYSRVLASKKIGPYLHRHHSIICIPRQQSSDFHNFEVVLNGTTFVASGQLNLRHGNLMRWPLYLHNSTTLSHVGWIGLTAMNVDKKGLEYIEGVAPETYADVILAYSRTLGASLGTSIVSDIK